MAAFNPMQTMGSGVPTGDMGMNHNGQPDMAMHHFEQELHFDDALLDGGALPPLPFTPSYDFEHFATTFEDPFSYSTRPFEPTPAPNQHHTHQDVLNEEPSPQELDNKLLGFSEPIFAVGAVGEMGKPVDLNMTAELYGMFFVAEDVFGGENTGRPLELTCYRRNLWQCSGQITMPRVITHTIDENGRQMQITEFSATITAKESIEGKPTEIISIPWKNSNMQAPEDPKVVGPPPSISLDLVSAQDLDSGCITVPVAWKRLQFKHATANNGRRKGLQQHYVVQISLVGKTKTGESVKIAEVLSSPVIVRGRSPRNFDSRKDVPLMGDKKMERRNTSSSVDAATIKIERENLLSQKRSASGDANSEWSNQPFAQPSHSPHPAKRVALSPTISKPPVPGWSVDGASNKSNVPRSALRQSTTAPINLSLSEDERSPNRSSAELQSPQLNKANVATGQVAGSSPPEEAEALYEYFPLSVDDWMPPVDAVYRPHVVHHTIVPPEVKAQQMQSKTKRYFTVE